MYKLGPQGECLIDTITWGHNPGANLQPFAAIQFSWQETPSCAGIPVGSQESYRTGTRIVTGASRLLGITAAAFEPSTYAPPPVIPGNAEHTRVITLQYNSATENCTSTSHSAYRTLASIQESAWGPNAPLVALPAVQFTYGSANFNQGALTWPQATTQQPAWGQGPTETFFNAHFNLGWGFRFTTANKWPTVEAIMLDLDGDGLLDRLVNDPVPGAGGIARCRASWQRNPGNG
jgi:hypothetical protein